ncbi:MAG TPA: hypothetical protein PK950_02585 [Candidatus Paceibacterota bacterium]|nr:hypothetical protein [Candidatus Paceibacterota bacterium]
MLEETAVKMKKQIRPGFHIILVQHIIMSIFAIAAIFCLLAVLGLKNTADMRQYDDQYSNNFVIGLSIIIYLSLYYFYFMWKVHRPVDINAQYYSESEEAGYDHVRPTIRDENYDSIVLGPNRLKSKT